MAHALYITFTTLHIHSTKSPGDYFCMSQAYNLYSTHGLIVGTWHSIEAILWYMCLPCYYVCIVCSTGTTQKMIKMNMPIVDGKVTFNATLLALVRTSLKIQCTGIQCMNRGIYSQ